MKRSRRWAIVGGLAFALAALVVGVTAASGGSAKKKKVVIGVSMDLTDGMKPFNSPALAAAQIWARKITAAGGPKFVFKICNDQAKNQKACAAQVIHAGAQIGLVTCDVELAAPATQEFINRGILAIAPCVTTDQMGPQRFGKKGRLAFTFGGTAQDEGSVEAEYAYSRGWRTAVVVKDNYLVYFRNVSDAFAKRFQELGGKIVQRESFASGDKTIGNVISRVAPTKADVISFVTAFGELPQFVGGIRSAGNKTPIINSWGGQGTYWNPKNPQVTEYYTDNYGSASGDDPNPKVNQLLKSLLIAKAVPYTASFVLGAATMQALTEAIKRSGGSTNGLKLAKTLEKFRNFPTISGPVTFSRTLHSVVGRPWRIMQIQDNKETFVKLLKTKKVVSLP